MAGYSYSNAIRMSDYLKIIECPRDAMQGLPAFIPTADKVKYLKQLLKVGFDTIDFGSFVSPKAVPQMKDTAAVLEQIDLASTDAKLLAIVANHRGAETAASFKEIAYLGYPLSISETFQKKNTNKTIVESLEEVLRINQLASDNNKELVLYLSMGFGNPYGDPYSIDIVKEFAGILLSLDIKIISLADTVGLATAEEVSGLFSEVKQLSNNVEWGLHLHASPVNAGDKIKAAIAAGCRRIDGAILGLGGCPFAKDELVGNLNTRTILQTADSLGLAYHLDEKEFWRAEEQAHRIFNQ